MRRRTRATAQANYIQATLKLLLKVVLVIRFGVIAVVAAAAAAQALTNLWWHPRWAMRRASVSAGQFWSETGLRICRRPLQASSLGSSPAPGRGQERAMSGAFGAAIAAGVAYGAIYLAAGAGPRERDWLRRTIVIPRRSDRVRKGRGA